MELPGWTRQEGGSALSRQANRCVVCGRPNPDQRVTWAEAAAHGCQLPAEEDLRAPESVFRWAGRGPGGGACGRGGEGPGWGGWKTGRAGKTQAGNTVNQQDFTLGTEKPASVRSK